MLFRLLIVLMLTCFSATSCNGGNSFLGGKSGGGGEQDKDKDKDKNKDTVVAPDNIDYIKSNMLDSLSSVCYNTQSSSDPYRKINFIINNNGDFAGQVYAKNDYNTTHCEFHPYIATHNQFRTIRFDSAVSCLANNCRLQINGFSDNNIVVGTTTNPTTEFIYDSNFKILPTWHNAYFHNPVIASNGTFIIYGGYTENTGYALMVYDYLSTQTWNFNFSVVDATLTSINSISNNGIAVGNYYLSKPVVCNLYSKNCEFISTIDNEVLNTISSNGKFIYGIANNKYVFRVDPNNYQVIRIDPIHEDLLKRTIGLSVTEATDDGLGLLTNDYLHDTYIYSASSNRLYKADDLLKKTGLSKYLTTDSEMHISPNGKYVVVDLGYSDYKNDTMAIKLYFANGLAQYLDKNVASLSLSSINEN